MSRSKHSIFTVTVSREGDRHGGGDSALCTALAELFPPVEGEAAPLALRDDVYFFKFASSIDPDRLASFGVEFLAGDPTRSATLLEGVGFPDGDGCSVVTVLRKPGVMDPVAGSVLHALRDSALLGDGCQVRTAHRFRIGNSVAGSRDTLRYLADQLSNPVVDEVYIFLAGEQETISDPFRQLAATTTERVEIPLCDLDDESLLGLSEEGGLSLALEEMQAIQAHYRQLNREPTAVELETLAQTWSEHCCHKTLTGPIDYDGERIDNLLGQTIFAVTRELDKPFCWSVFRDNAGVIALDEEWGLTFKVETHNHPSALEPYGGAGTGTGGVIRDTLGTGLGARPILSTDVFCFGPLDASPDVIPTGSLHPRRLLAGVVAGVRDYGNRMGIPTGNGAIHFHPGYIGNPLVFCGSVGLIPRSCVEKEVQAGDLIVAIGGRTGRDGIHGATFSSRELTEESETVSAGAVQIGNPIEEKKVLEAMLRARDEGLFSFVTDCGAGGFSSAVGEMGEQVGAEVELANAPLKYEGLSPHEIWISEAQERMVLAVPPKNIERLFAILEEEEVEGCTLGTFTGDGQLRLLYDGTLMGEMSMKFLHDGRPRIVLAAKKSPKGKHFDIDPEGATAEEILCQLLAHPTIASKEPVIRQYDHEVQSRTVIKPLMGTRGDAPLDACALDPLRDGMHTVVVGCGLQPLLGEVDPYQMGAQAVDEAVRNVMACGGSLDRMALLDNFAWGNVHDPEILGACIECARGAAAAALAYGAPFVSGKDSLHNTYRAGGVSRSIPHTLLVTAISVVDGSPLAPSSDLKESGSTLLLLGPQCSGISGSFLQYLYAGAGGEPAPFDVEMAPRTARQLESWLKGHRVLSCHDLSEGGLAVAAAEMGIGADGQGIDLRLDDLAAELTLEDLLFGESPHRYLLEVRADVAKELLRESDVPLHGVGQVTDSGRFAVVRNGDSVIDADLADLRQVWRQPLFDVWRSPS